VALAGGGAAPLAALVGLYAGALAAVSIAIARGQDAPRAALVPRLLAVIAAQQIGYGIGTLVGHWDAWRHGRGRERFARLTR